MVTRFLTPKEVVDELCDVQGRKLAWLARRLGIPQQTLTNNFAGRPGFHWRAGQQQAIADLLGVPLHYIWRQEEEAVPAATGPHAAPPDDAGAA